MSTYKLKNLSIKDQAYYILEALNGSWIVEALWDQLQNEVICKSIIDNYLMDASEVSDTTIQEHINEFYQDLLEFRAAKEYLYKE